MAVDSAFSAPNALGSLNSFVEALVAVLLPLILTYALTTFNANWIRNVRGKGNPPPVPYALPVLGNTFQFAYDTEGFITKTIKRFGRAPFRLFVGLETMYYIPHGAAVQAMFKHARDLSMKPIIVVAMRDQFGMSARDLAVFERDHSGDEARPLEGFEDVDPAHRVLYQQHRDLHLMLNGAALEGMMGRFVGNYTAYLRDTEIVGQGEEWVELPDFYGFLRDAMFQASCKGLLGERVFEVAPELAREFWAFDQNLLTYFRRTPRWLAPSAYVTRDRALAALKKWVIHAREKLDYRDPSLAGVEYEPIWGSRLMRMRAEMFDNAGFSLDGAVCQDLGFLWASNANVIPATLWGMLNVLVSENLTARVTAELAECFDESTDKFDVAALCAKPLLTGVYLESLRHCAAVTSARNPVTDNFQLAGWSMPRNSLMLSIVWFGAHDPDFWNQGRLRPDGKPEHPVDTYWAERFLEYPNDPASGPVKKPDASIYTTPAKNADKPKTAEDDKTAKPISSTAALQGYFYPYGGGTRICPGRHLAKQEMLVALAGMMKAFEIEILDPVAARHVKPDMRAFPTGAMGPDRKVAVRIRRRRGW
ncbi:cytochrome P450 [Dichotomopilus funicola]|uniref:Cytochrome P450 n=1 Tax=Dichotomopilus funicola TaxID=1934379 RepID=A0AAN6V1S6_9PEZI|nr:cytochrome P450 [Dichotomopilus funicola]